MDIRRLTYFLFVADHRGFTAAARATHVSQPALSLAVKELEVELGATLLQRMGRQVRLTPAGQALIGPARQVLRDLETGRAAVADVVGLSSGSVSLCSLPTLAADPLARLAGRFRRAHPAVRLELAAPDDTEELLSMLRNGQCELGLSDHSSRPVGDADIVGSVVASQQLWIVFPPGSPPPPNPIPLRTLAGVPMITTPVGTSSRKLLQEALGRVGVEPLVAVTTAQRDAILPLVLSGAGTAMVPHTTARAAARFGAVVAPPEPRVDRPIAMLHRRGTLAPAAQALFDLARRGA